MVDGSTADQHPNGGRLTDAQETELDVKGSGDLTSRFAKFANGCTEISLDRLSRRGAGIISCSMQQFIEARIGRHDSTHISDEREPQ